MISFCFRKIWIIYCYGTIQYTGSNLAFLKLTNLQSNLLAVTRGGSKTAATFKIERFVIIVNGFQALTIITKRSILDAEAVLDPPLITK